jgi:hypothetical protein
MVFQAKYDNGCPSNNKHEQRHYILTWLFQGIPETFLCAFYS